MSPQKSEDIIDHKQLYVRKSNSDNLIVVEEADYAEDQISPEELLPTNAEAEAEAAEDEAEEVEVPPPPESVKEEDLAQKKG